MKSSQQPSEAVRFSARLSSVVFRFVCSCHGLDLGFPRIRVVGIAFWLVVSASYPFTVLLYFRHQTHLTQDEVSLSDVMAAVGGIVYIVSTLASVNAFIVKHKKVERLLRSDPTAPEDVFVSMLCSAPFFVTCIGVISRAKDVVLLIGYMNYVSFDFSKIAFFIIYANVSSSLLARLGRLNKVIQRAGMRRDYLTREKLSIREDIMTVNSIFARYLSLHYVQLFVDVVFDFAAVMGDLLRNYEKAFLLASLCTRMIMLHQAARKGSLIISQCLDTEFQLWALGIDRPDVHKSATLWETMRVFRFREEWDTLKVACFTSSSANFFRYLSTVVTCVAVVMQFDFKVLRTMTNLTKSPL